MHPLYVSGYIAGGILFVGIIFDGITKWLCIARLRTLIGAWIVATLILTFLLSLLDIFLGFMDANGQGANPPPPPGPPPGQPAPQPQQPDAGAPNPNPPPAPAPQPAAPAPQPAAPAPAPQPGPPVAPPGGGPCPGPSAPNPPQQPPRVANPCAICGFVHDQPCWGSRRRYN